MGGCGLGTRLCPSHPTGAPSCFNIHVGLGWEGRKSGRVSGRKRDAGWLDESLKLTEGSVRRARGPGRQNCSCPLRVGLKAKLTKTEQQERSTHLALSSR